MKRILILALLSAGAFAKMAPPFQVNLLDGKRLSLKESLKEDRWLLLSFWATWCSPCLDELTTITKRLKSDATLPLDVLAVNVDTADTSSEVKSTVKFYQFSIPVALDPKHEIFSKYHFEKSLPYSVLINSKGEIVSSFNGYNEEMFKLIEQKTKVTIQ